MSAPQYRIAPKLIASLHERGETVESLARKAGTGRAHATQVLANKPGRGYHTRKKLARHLTMSELELVGWNLGGTIAKPWHVNYQPSAFHAERSNSTEFDRHAQTVAGLREEPGCETPGVADSALQASNGKPWPSTATKT